jgi:hypothetical protein
VESGITLLPKELAQIIEARDLFLFQADLTPAKAYGCKNMSSFIKSHEKDLYRALELLIANLAMNVNVKYNLKPEQAPYIARSIYRKYSFYSIEEVALVLRMGAEGELGKIFDRLSVDMIMDWFVTYDLTYREPFVINYRQQLNNEYERNMLDVIAIPEISKAFDKIINRLKEDEEKDLKREENYQSWKKKYFESKKESELKNDNQVKS